MKCDARALRGNPNDEKRLLYTGVVALSVRARALAPGLVCDMSIWRARQPLGSEGGRCAPKWASTTIGHHCDDTATDDDNDDGDAAQYKVCSNDSSYSRLCL